MPAVSVITPCFNSERFVLEMIESVQAQSFQDWELILVDDGSTDGTLEVLEEAARSDPRLKVISTPNGGVSKARNRGLAERDPTSDFVAFLDSDDAWLPDTLTSLLSAFDHSPHAVAAFGWSISMDETGRQLDAPGEHRIYRLDGGRVRTVRPPNRLDLRSSIALNPVTSPGQALVRIAAADGDLWFDEDLAIVEDWDLWIRLLARGDIILLHQPTLLYRRHAGNATRDHDRERRQREGFFARRLRAARDRPEELELVRDAYLFALYSSNGYFSRRWALEAATRGQGVTAARLVVRSLRWDLRRIGARARWSATRRRLELLGSGALDASTHTPSPTLSVGLAVHNGDAHLAEAIESILSQTFTDFELIVCDNASTDATQEICEHYRRMDRRIRYYRNRTNIGGANNENLTVQYARGRYFRWAADDDVCEPTLFERCIDHLEHHPEVVLCYTGITGIDEDGEPFRDLYEQRGTASRPSERLRELLPSDHACEPTYGVVRTEMLLPVGLQRNYPDSDRVLLCALAMRGPFVQLDERLFKKRFHARNVYTDVRARVNWFKPTSRQRVRLPAWIKGVHLLYEITRAPLPLMERGRCLGEVFRWAVQSRRTLAGDLVYSATSLVRRPTERWRYNWEHPDAFEDPGPHGGSPTASA
jgi:glycosyltransferase involved in cell wall biosynthesis